MLKLLASLCICFLSYTYSYSQCDSLQIVNHECYCTTYLVNIFTPNNDGLNDSFGFNSNCEITEKYDLKTFNRYGETVYKTNDFTQEWDGYYNGKLCASGVYTCVIRFQYKYQIGIRYIRRNVLLKI